jgi:hypothetical protein
MSNNSRKVAPKKSSGPAVKQKAPIFVPSPSLSQLSQYGSDDEDNGSEEDSEMGIHHGHSRWSGDSGSDCDSDSDEEHDDSDDIDDVIICPLSTAARNHSSPTPVVAGVLSPAWKAFLDSTPKAKAHAKADDRKVRKSKVGKVFLLQCNSFLILSPPFI